MVHTGADRRRIIFQRDEVVVWMCAVLEFIKETALPGMLSTERSEGGGASNNPMVSLALSSMVTEFDRDCDDKLNDSEFRRLVRACTKKAGTLNPKCIMSTVVYRETTDTGLKYVCF